MFLGFNWYEYVESALNLGVNKDIPRVTHAINIYINYINIYIYICIYI